MPLLYDIGLGLYQLGIRAAAPFKPKARAWCDGRKDLWQRLELKSASLQGCLWMHCASIGEFEQGRPVLEAIKAARPELPVLLTFFSPSGYEARKDFPLAAHVDLLPMDSASNARWLVDLVKPKAVLWVKYEFWYHYLRTIKSVGIPAFLVSAIFRREQSFFRWYGATFRKMLRCFDRLFVQDDASRELLAAIGVTNVTISGDTRFDRVVAMAQEAKTIAFADHMERNANGRLLVCGSTWPEDERLLASVADTVVAHRVIVPHEISADHLRKLSGTFDPPPMPVSDYEARMKDPDFYWSSVVVDRYGILSTLYRYADVAYIGGGFGDGIHSLLEAAVWETPVIFGPRHTKFAEAKGLIDAGGGFEVKNAEELEAVLGRLLGDPAALGNASFAAGKYVRERVGATEKVVEHVLEVV